MKTCTDCGLVMDDHEWPSHMCERDDGQKDCPECGHTIHDTAFICPECKFEYGYEDGPVNASVAPFPNNTVVERPDGAVPLLLGYICLGLGAFAFLAMLNYAGQCSSLDSYGCVDAAGKAFVSQMLATGLIGTGLFFWSVGYIVRAISFLPEKDKG